MTAKRSVSTEKIWMKHYPAESQHITPPKMKIYTFLKESNKHRLRDVALYYYGKRITVKRLINRMLLNILLQRRVIRCHCYLRLPPSLSLRCTR